MLAVTAFVDKGPLQPGKLLIQEVICLVDQADQSIGNHCGVGVVQPGLICFLIRLIGPILPISRMRSMLLPNRPYCFRRSVVLRPLLLAALAQKVFIIQQQFIQTGAGNVHQAQLGLA